MEPLLEFYNRIFIAVVNTPLVYNLVVLVLLMNLFLLVIGMVINCDKHR